MLKHFQGARIKQVDGARRRIQFVASQETVDADGDVVLQDGIDRSRYSSNPVLLANHDITFPVGKVTAMRVETRSGGKATVCEADLLPAGTSRRVDELWAAIQCDVVKGISIGFRILDSAPRPGQGLTIKRAELYEISIVTVPACASCLIEQKAHRPRQTAAVVCTSAPRLSITGDPAVPRYRLRDTDTVYLADPAAIRDTVRAVLVRAVVAAADVAVRRALAAAQGRVED